jgi:PAS domain S-box-containing protein
MTIDFQKDNLSGMKVLIVDDTLANIHILELILKQDGLSISIATNGSSALKIIAQDKPDLILLDIMMPEIDGYEVCRILKEQECTRDIPIIFVTAKDQTKDLVKGFEVGGVDYIVKPFEESEVLARTRTQLSLRKMTQEAISLSKFPSENPHPVLRVSEEFKLLYANVPAQKLLAKHKCHKGESVPENYRKAVEEATHSSTGSAFEVYHDSQYYLFNIIRVPGAGYFNFYGSDITANRGIALALQKNEARTRLIIDLAVDCIVTINEMGEIQSVNPATIRTFQYLESELIGKTIKALIPGPSPSRPDNQILNNSGKILPKLVGQKHEFWGLRKDGQQLSLSTTISGVLIGDERTFTLIMRDITEKRKADLELQESKEHIAKIIESALDAIIMIDCDGEIIAWNNQAEIIFGWTEDESIGKNLANLIIPKEYQQAHRDGLKKYLETGEGQVLNTRIEITAIRKFGQEFPVELSITPIVHGDNVNFSGFIRDLTEKKKSEKKLQDATKAAQASSKAKSEFLANTSHEIRTPLNAITGFSGILLKLLKQDKVDEDFEQYLGIIVRSGENLTEVINNVLDLSKIESGKMELHKEPFDLKVVIKSLVSIYKHQAMVKGIELEYRYDKNLEGLIISDRVKLNQILTNLIGNAIKFTEKGIINIEVQKQDNKIHFTVKDSGIGISNDKVDIIFNAFEQADSSTTRNYGGSGLGLAITKKMTELLGGRIGLESIEGKGSEFYFDIPFEEVAKTENISAENHEISFSSNNKILLVEDNEENLLLVQVLLKGFGLKPILARNGVEAIQKAKESSPDLILMDVQMPEMDGLQATKQIREINGIKNTPIVGLSAHAMKEHEEDAFEVGMDDYLTKPLDSEKLEKILIKHLKSI